MSWKEIFSELVRVRRLRDKAQRSQGLANLLAEAGIDPATVTGYDDAFRKVDRVARLRCVQERQVVPGKVVVVCGRNPSLIGEVQCVDRSGRVRIKGVRGAFNPSLLVFPLTFSS